MRRVDRLFDIVQFLRGGRLRTAQEIADRLDVSVRTIYRDIDALVLTGVPIEGERGVGYILRGTLLLPPLTFTAAEMESLALGARFVGAWADPELADAAREALIKIDAVLPDAKRGDLWRDAIHVYSPSLIASGNEHLRLFRSAIREHRKVRIHYRTAGEAPVSERVVRPLAIEAWGHAWTVTTWCEWRDDFRTFRLDRIETVEALEERFRPEKGKLLKDYLDRLRARGLDRYGKPLP